MTTGNEPKIEEQIEKAAHQDWCRWWSLGDLCSCGAVSALESQPAPVEPDELHIIRRLSRKDPLVDYIDSLQSALQRAQEKAVDDCKLWRDRRDEALTALEKAEAINRRMVELLKEPYGYVYVTNNTWTHFTKMKPPDDAYDEGSLVPVYAAPAEQDRVDAVCQWEQDDEGGYWETQCGEAFEIIDGTPEQNGMKYCHHCGKTLRARSAK